MQYGLIVRRLEAYRRKNNIPQTELARDLDITQSQYSKIELGKVKLSYKVLNKLYEKGWDIDMIITGESSTPVLQSLAEAFDKNDTRQYISGMKLCEWAMEQWAQKESKETMLGSRLLKNFLDSVDGITPLENLRKAFDISQIKMSEIVGVNIKKYRALEKGELELDAELMANIYEATKCKPIYFMDEKAFYLSVVSEQCQYGDNREKQLNDLLSIKEKFN